MSITSPQNEELKIGDIVLAETLTEFLYCREVVTLAATQTVLPGTLLKNNGDGTWSVWDEESTDGTVDGIALEYATASVPATILALVRGAAIVHSKYLSDDTDAIRADLAAIGILVRDNPTEYVMQ